MLYFNSMPKVLTPDANGTETILTNLMARTEIIPSLLDNPLMFYKYDIQDGDTPEIVAHKYYGDSYRYWIVLYANQILDPQWNWPLNNHQFDTYLINKYSVNAEDAGYSSAISYTQSVIKEYRKTIKSTDSISLVETIETFVIDETAYNQPLEPSETYQLPNSIVTRNISKAIISLYDYELEQNESKRNINLINKIYVSQIEQQFKSLMSQ
jgi:hypothetical protein